MGGKSNMLKIGYLKMDDFLTEWVLTFSYMDISVQLVQENI